ncbi:MAG TPA: EF-hand domain-containing protein [Steroidobacteraceae bacterium]|nr:EF-hand domain-containing protein [Steroidobacteraceae bacterium]
MTTRTNFLMLAGVAVLAAAPLATAQTLSPSQREGFELADYDGDGVVSWEEFHNRLVHIFHNIDRDENGIIEGEEHLPATTPDGKAVQPPAVRINEFMDEIRRVFYLADKDQSGGLSKAEWGVAQPDR